MVLTQKIVNRINILKQVSNMAIWNTSDSRNKFCTRTHTHKISVVLFCFDLSEHTPANKPNPEWHRSSTSFWIYPKSQSPNPRTFNSPPFPFKNLPFPLFRRDSISGLPSFPRFRSETRGCGIRKLTLKCSIGTVNAIGVVCEEFFCGFLIPEKHNVLGRPWGYLPFYFTCQLSWQWALSLSLSLSHIAIHLKIQ